MFDEERGEGQGEIIIGSGGEPKIEKAVAARDERIFGQADGVVPDEAAAQGGEIGEQGGEQDNGGAGPEESRAPGVRKRCGHGRWATTLSGLMLLRVRRPRVARRLATLGWTTKSLWDSTGRQVGSIIDLRLPDYGSNQKAESWQGGSIKQKTRGKKKEKGEST